MKRYINFIFIFSFIFFSLALASCSSFTVSSSYNHSFNFTKIISYKIAKELPKHPDGAQMPSVTFSLIKSAIDLEMVKKSYGKNNQLADFGITWQTALNDDVFAAANMLKNWEGAFSENEEGMLIIDIIDLDSGNVVWRGWAKNVLNSQNLEEEINEAVTEILSNFPPENPLGLEE